MYLAGHLTLTTGISLQVGHLAGRARCSLFEGALWESEPILEGELALVIQPTYFHLDLFSSLRIPSAFCGLYTLRPSYGRLPYYGAHNALLGQESISSVLGPMANSLSGVEVFMKAIIGAKPWNLDPLVIRKPWDGEEYGLAEHGGDSQEKKLAFAIMWDNGVVRPHPPLVRAMKMTKAALEASGHTGQPVKPMYKSIGWEMLSVVFAVIDWVPHRHLEIYKNAVGNHLKTLHATGKMYSP